MIDVHYLKEIKHPFGDIKWTFYDSFKSFYITLNCHVGMFLCLYIISNGIQINIQSTYWFFPVDLFSKDTVALEDPILKKWG